ncbi:Crp/Fnr family transcriptional regulator [Halobacteriovorax sp. HLS]|uniref:Crp/Fnr family transcriptional regulator n=1 Tax=Halobacteriovorax sp. HLS TaxID=2234000 RepID=UPI000FDAF5D7|nr:cyclic nucleotide-binding domain-containing protein [Halobacteriovorax sp. HLS]
MSVLEIVKGSSLFYELYDEEILKIVENCQVLNLTKGDYIFKEKEEGDEIFLILQGSAEVIKNDITIGKLRKGDLFGEMVLLKERTRNADTVASTFCDVLVLKYDDIFSLYNSDNKIFSILMLNLARMLATRLKKTGQSIAQLKQEKEKDKAA